MINEIYKIFNETLKIKNLCVEGLLTDGGHHKQWYLEEVLKVLGFNLEDLRKKLNKEDYDWDERIPP